MGSEAKHEPLFISQTVLGELRYLSTSAGAPSAADRVAGDGPCESGLQQLLSPGVQAVQLLHGDWSQRSEQS